MLKNYAAGIDVGGTFIKYVFADAEGKIIYSSKLPVGKNASAESVMALIVSAIEDCKIRAKEENGQIVGAGVGFPGVVSDGMVHGGADNLSGFTDIPLAKLLAEQTRLETVLVDNDANMMGWGEVMYGAAENLSDVIFLTVGTGIGGAMVINGRLYGGYKNRGTELGHLIVENGGLHCSCGASGCLEAYASVTALIHHYAWLKNQQPDTIDGKTIVENYLAGEPEAVAAMDWHYTYLSAGITSLINIFSPQRVIIGGGIAEAGSFYIDSLESRVHAMAMKETSAHTSIHAARLGNWAGCLGGTGRVFSFLQN